MSNKNITLLVSSGGGPEECCQAVVHVLNVISQEAQERGLQLDVAAENSSYGSKSAIIRLYGGAASQIADRWIGTIQWTCKSRLRPKHKRQNWFVGVFELPQVTCSEPLDENLIRFESFRAGGPGGQHQNTTDSAVRATCTKTNVSVVVRDDRSQHRNKSIAIERLRDFLAAQNKLQEVNQRKHMNLLHQQLQRGSPIRSFKGTNFKEVII